MRFNRSKKAEAFLEEVADKVQARTVAVLGRSALMLALNRNIPTEWHVPKGDGTEIGDETVIGEEMMDLVRIALNYRAGETLDDIGYKRELRRYFEYGCFLLENLWDDCRHDPIEFVAQLTQFTTSVSGGSSIATMDVVNNIIKLKILSDTPEWEMNKSGGNSLLVISGHSGKGKSQLALDLLAQLAQQGGKFLFFDLKGELEIDEDGNQQHNQNREKFLAITGAKYYRLINESLPINPLYQGNSTAENSQIASELAEIVRGYAPNIGANQEAELRDNYRAIESPDFYNLLENLRENGAEGSLVNTLANIADKGIFTADDQKISFEEWTKQSLVIDFKSLGMDNTTKSLVVALILNFFMKKLNRNLGIVDEVQPIKMVLFVDEAHLILPKDKKTRILESLARQGRSWGFPLWLASQDADKFVTEGVDFVGDVGASGVHFSPEQVTGGSMANKLFGKNFTKGLNDGEAVLRLGSTAAIVGKARQFWQNF